MTYVVSLLLGFAVGVTYALVKVPPPAPPVVALIGLLEMLGGENATTWARGKLEARHRTSMAPIVSKIEAAAIEQRPACRRDG